jgi:hypothetical protein
VGGAAGGKRDGVSASGLLAYADVFVCFFFFFNPPGRRTFGLQNGLCRSGMRLEASFAGECIWCRSLAGPGVAYVACFEAVVGWGGLCWPL